MKKLHSAFIGAVLLTAISATTLLILPVHAQTPPANANANGSVANQTSSIGSQTAAPSVDVSVSSQAAHKFETNPILSLPQMFARQWIPDRENLPRDYFPLTEDNEQHKLSLKETIYLALENNPGLKSVSLDPVAATESVAGSNAVFDPQLSSQIDVEKEVTPVSSPFQNPNSISNVSKFYDWNFGMSKVLSAS